MNNNGRRIIIVIKRLEMTEEEEVEYMKTRHAKSNPITDEEIEAALKSDVAEFYKKYNPSKLETNRDTFTIAISNCCKL